MAELVGLCAAGLFALGFHVTLPGRLTSDEDYRRVAEVLAAEAEPGDVVLLYPWWTDRARLFLPDGLPIVGYFGSDGDDLVRHPRVWVLAQPKLPKSDWNAFERAFGPNRTVLKGTRRFGNLALTLYRNGRHRPVLFWASDALAGARAYLESPNGRADCASGPIHRCPNGVRVASEWHEVRFQPRRCVYLKPPGGPARTVVEFPSVPAGSKLVLEAGIIWEWAAHRDSSLTPTHVGVDDATGRTLLRLTLPVGVEQLFRAETAEAPQGPLRLWVQSHNADRREICADLYSLGGPP